MLAPSNQIKSKQVFIMVIEQNNSIYLFTYSPQPTIQIWLFAYKKIQKNLI